MSDAMSQLARRGRLNAMKVDAHRFDAGDKLGYLKANVELGLRHPKSVRLRSVLARTIREEMMFFIATLLSLVVFGHIPEFGTITSRAADQHGAAPTRSSKR